MNSILKGVIAVIAGFLAVVVLSIATDMVLENLGIFPPPTEGLFVTWMLALALFYRLIYALAGGYITGRLAPDPKMRYVYILTGIGFVAGVAGVIFGWNLSQHWYPIALAVLSPVMTVIGGKLAR